MSVTVTEPAPLGICAHLQICGEPGDLAGQHQHSATRLGAGLQPPRRPGTHLHTRPDEHEIEAVDHRCQYLAPGTVVEEALLLAFTYCSNSSAASLYFFKSFA